MAHAAALREEPGAGYACTRPLQNLGEPAVSIQKLPEKTACRQTEVEQPSQLNRPIGKFRSEQFGARWQATSCNRKPTAWPNRTDLNSVLDPPIEALSRGTTS
jgi:hypothetical protein